VISIRRAHPSDAATVAELGRRTFVETFAAQNAPEDLQAYVDATYGEAQQRREIEHPEIVTLLAEEGGEAVAFAQVRRAPTASGDVELARFYVDRPFHGRGVASLLMRAVLDAAGELGARSIWLGVWEQNARAIAFYTKCGFAFDGTKQFVLGSDLQTDLVMRREL